MCLKDNSQPVPSSEFSWIHGFQHLPGAEAGSSFINVTAVWNLKCKTDLLVVTLAKGLAQGVLFLVP